MTLLLLWGINLSVHSNNYDKLLLDAIKAGNEKDVTFYLNKGADVNAYDQSQSTALILATLSCNFEIVYMLCKHGANVELKDNNNLSAVEYANNCGCLRIKELLLNPVSYNNTSSSFNYFYEKYVICLQKKDYKQALFYAENANNVMNKEFDKTKNSIWPSIIIENLANLYMLQYDYIKAEPLLIEAVELKKRILGEKAPEYLLSLNDLAVLYQKNGKYIKAESLYKECIEKYRLLQIFNLNYATTCSNLGIIYSEFGNYIDAERFLNEAIIIFKKYSQVQTSEYATLLNNLATVYSGMGNLNKAENLELMCLKIRKNVLGENYPDYARSLSSLGRLYSLIGDYARSESYLLNAIELQKKFLEENNPDIINTLCYLGSVYQDMGIYSKAEKYYIEALRIEKKIFGEHNKEYADILNDFALLNCDLGNYYQSEQIFLKVLQIQESILGKKSMDYANTLDNLAGLYRHFEYEKELLPIDLRIRDLVKTNFGVTDSLYINQNKIIEGRNYCIKKYSECDSLYLEALKIRKEILGANHPSCATTLNNLAGLYEEKGDFINAEKMNLRAIKIYESVYGINHPLYRNALNNLAAFYWKQNDFIKSEVVFGEDLKYQIKLIQDNFSFLSDNERALNWNKTKSMFFETFYPSFAYSYYPQKPSISTFAYDNTLFTKGLLLNTSLQIQNAVLQSGDTALIGTWNNLRDLKRQLNVLQSKPLAQQGDLHIMEALADSLDKVLTQKSQLYKQSQSDMQIKWTDVQKNLKPDEAAIEFISFDYYNKHYTDSTMYCALVLKKNSPYPEMISLFEEKQLDSLFVNTKNRDDTENIVFEQYRGLSNSRKDSIIVSKLYYGKKLYNLLWKPLEVSLKNMKTVYYAPSGKLNQVAFAAIPVDTTFLLSDKYNLHQLTSTRQVIHNNEQDKQTAKIHKAALFGGIEYELDDKQLAQVQTTSTKSNRSAFVSDSTQRSNTFVYLKGTGEEVEGIAKEFKIKGLTDQLYTGADASEGAFKKLSGTNTDIIHVATHGFYLPIEDTKRKDFKFMGFDNERRNVVIHNPLLRSGLAFAGANRAWRDDSIPNNCEDGILTSHEISQLNLTHTDLVVLSACETALGDIKGSEGVFGLQRAFKMAGIQTLIMSLWRVDDKATSELMQNFYKYWLGGMTKHDAFKKAQNDIRTKIDANGEKIYSNPYYWAAFIMVD